MKIGFLGGGKMAEGILSTIPAKKDVIVAEKLGERAAYLRGKYGVAVTGDVREVVAAADLVFLAVRPGDVAAVAAEVKPLLRRGQTLVSIAAGKRLAFLRSVFGSKAKLVRVMPNLALRAGEGMCALTPRNAAVEEILGRAGKTVVLPEKDFDAVTALSGSGPAYFAAMCEAMAEGGVALGLRPSVARLLAEQTMFGTAKFLRESGIDLGVFIAGVATKGGTTAAGMRHLGRPAFRTLVAKTLAAAAKRSAELA